MAAIDSLEAQTAALRVSIDAAIAKLGAGAPPQDEARVQAVADALAQAKADLDAAVAK